MTQKEIKEEICFPLGCSGQDQKCPGNKNCVIVRSIITCWKNERKKNMKFSELNVISIDPSLRSTGVYVNAPIAEEEYSEAITPKGTRNRLLAILLGRIETCMYPELANVIDICLIEKQFMNNVQQMVYGIIIASIARLGIKIIEVQPRVWQAITGMGAPLSNYDKKTESGRSMYLVAVKFMYGKLFETTDEADAYMMYRAVCDIMDKPGKLTPAAEKIRQQIEEILK